MRRNPATRPFGMLSARKILTFTTLAAAFMWASTARGQVPGPEIFGNPPKTPLELWDAIDYLTRTGQAKQAVPYLNAFMKANPDDAMLLRIRDDFGVVSILRLVDDPATRPVVKTLVDRLTEASLKHARDPERIARAIQALMKSASEQKYAVVRLREAGAYAVPALIAALNRPELSEGERTELTQGMGRLDEAAVPPLIAALDASDARTTSAAAAALGRIRDPRAVPQLTFLAARSKSEGAERAVERITRTTFANRPFAPARLLVAEARRYHTHTIDFPSGRVIVWIWDEAAKTPVPREMSRAAAENYFGVKLAREALTLNPGDVDAQVALVALTLEAAAIAQGGASKVAATDPAYTNALATGAQVLGRVVRQAIADRKPEVAALAVNALAQVTDRDAFTIERRPNPLIEALAAPDRRVQFAAARALVLLDPAKTFPGSSRVVPTLARFVASGPLPRAVIIDGNLSRGGQLAGFLKTLGYEPMVAATGDQGFRLAARAADVELIFVDPHMVQGAWRLDDVIANLRAEPATAGLPIYVYGGLALELTLADLFKRYPDVKYLVQPTSPERLEAMLGGRPSALTDGERGAYAREAAALLARVASRAGGPFTPDLEGIEPALTIALNTPETSVAASAALSEVPSADAQRGLADVLLDPSRSTEARVAVAARLSRSIQRFGPLVSAEQEARLLRELAAADDPGLKNSLAIIVGALRPKAVQVGRRLLGEAAVPPAPAAVAKPKGEAEPDAEP